MAFGCNRTFTAEVVCQLIAFVIGGLVGDTIMRLWRRANSQRGNEVLRIELAKLQGEKHPIETTS